MAECPVAVIVRVCCVGDGDTQYKRSRTVLVWKHLVEEETLWLFVVMASSPFPTDDGLHGGFQTSQCAVQTLSWCRVTHEAHTHTTATRATRTRQTNTRQRRLARATHASLAQGSMATRHSAVLLRVITHPVNMTRPQHRNHPHTTVSNTTAGRGVNTQRHNNGCGRCSPHQAWCERNRWNYAANTLRTATT